MITTMIHKIDVCCTRDNICSTFACLSVKLFVPRALVALYMTSNRLSNMNKCILKGLFNFIILIITSM